MCGGERSAANKHLNRFFFFWINFFNYIYLTGLNLLRDRGWGQCRWLYSWSGSAFLGRPLHLLYGGHLSKQLVIFPQERPQLAIYVNMPTLFVPPLGFQRRMRPGFIEKRSIVTIFRDNVKVAVRHFL